MKYLKTAHPLSPSENSLFPFFNERSELYFNCIPILMKIIPVTCAIIIHEGKVLLAQRSATMDLPGKWEFPGGKVEDGEDPKACLVREIREELSIEIRVMETLTPVDYAYPTKTIRLLPFLAEWISGKIMLSEHAQFAWYDKNQLFSLDLAPADLPILHELTEKWVNLVVAKKR